MLIDLSYDLWSEEFWLFFNDWCLDSYMFKSENLSLTLENKWCHAELGSASYFVQKVRS